MQRYRICIKNSHQWLASQACKTKLMARSSQDISLNLSSTRSKQVSRKSIGLSKVAFDLWRGSTAAEKRPQFNFIHRQWWIVDVE